MSRTGLEILQFTSLYQVPVVGPDVCGFSSNVTETLYASSFYIFFRNHAKISSTSQEFYRWPTVAESAHKSISIRYQLLSSSAPSLKRTAQGTGKPVRGRGEYISAEVNYTDITVHYKGGIVYPQHIESANTTTALRKKGFNIVIAPGLDGTAEGSLYLDDGKSVVQDVVSEIDFKYAHGKLSMTGTFEYDIGVNIETIIVLGVDSKLKTRHADYDAKNKKLVVHVDVPLTKKAHVKVL
ncbi:unnamed protein product [Penicillium manginii]